MTGVTQAQIEASYRMVCQRHAHAEQDGEIGRERYWAGARDILRDLLHAAGTSEPTKR